MHINTYWHMLWGDYYMALAGTWYSKTLNLVQRATMLEKTMGKFKRVSRPVLKKKKTIKKKMRVWGTLSGKEDIQRLQQRHLRGAGRPRTNHSSVRPLGWLERKPNLSILREATSGASLRGWHIGVVDWEKPSEGKETMAGQATSWGYTLRWPPALQNDTRFYQLKGVTELA